MVEKGLVRGQSSPIVFWHPDHGNLCVAHGDDFMVLPWETQLDWLWGVTQKRLESKYRGRLGPWRNDKKQIRALKRMVEWTDAEIVHEGDQRHAKSCIKQMGLDGSTRKVLTPVDRSGKDQRNASSLRMKGLESQPLSASAATTHRGMKARINYLGQDRSEIHLRQKS